MSKDTNQFPYVVAYGISRLFRVRHISVGVFHVEQRLKKSAENGQTENWKILAISNHSQPDEALGVMHEDQTRYALEVQRRQGDVARALQ